MSEIPFEVAAMATTNRSRTNYFTWSTEMELLLVKAVGAHKAHIKSKLQADTYEVKYNRLVAARKVFSVQGSRQTWSTIQGKFRIMSMSGAEFLAQ